MIQPRRLIGLCLFAAACARPAQAAETPRLDRTAVHDLFSQAKDLLRRANQAAASDPAAARDLYQKAILRLELIVRKGGVRNGKLYYNIGNAYFRMGDLGRAILYYRRAERLIPDDPNLRQNLHTARRQRRDKIEVPERTRVLHTLFFWHYDFSTQIRLTLFTVCFALVWVCAIARRFSRKALLAWGIVLSAVLAAMLFGSLLVEELHDRGHVGGVVLAPEVVARKGDSETYQASFEEPLHAGSEFERLERRGDWLHVALADGRRCWLPAKAVALVRQAPD